ncbi:MAG: hypothetical protein HXY41_00920 [Chloroflexi bacterium]|nr:hypothetical protein [Chloroflexota bacterium]
MSPFDSPNPGRGLGMGYAAIGAPELRQDGTTTVLLMKQLEPQANPRRFSGR